MIFQNCHQQNMIFSESLHVLLPLESKPVPLHLQLQLLDFKLQLLDLLLVA